MEKLDLLPSWILIQSNQLKLTDNQEREVKGKVALSQFYPIPLDFAQFRKIAP